MNKRILTYLTVTVLLAALLAVTLSGCELSVPEINIPDGSDGNGSQGGDGNDSGTSGGDNGSTDNSGGGSGTHICDMKLISDKPYTCTEMGERVYKCECGKKETVLTPPMHTTEVQKGREPTCSDVGYTDRHVCTVCGEVVHKAFEIPKLPHTEVIDPAEDATGHSPAKSEGKHCSVCGYVIVKQHFIYPSGYSTPDNYDGTYGYESLLALKNGTQLGKLYMMIDEAADQFHSSGIDLPESENGVIARLDYSALGLTSGEALAAWSAYRQDRPLYYWLSNNIGYTSSELYISCDAEYLCGSVRDEKNAIVYDAAREMIEAASTSSAYHTALAFHDMIILAADYAYETDGLTPSSAAVAHGVLGIFDTGEGVCEAYAKAFQLLLNYCKIDNIVVSGYAGEAHAWNLVRLDNGEWYWCDLTWDDTPSFMWGISHKYFMKTDTADLSGMDGPWVGTETTFLASHTPSPVINEGVDYNYPIPERAEAEYTGQDILRATFDIDGMTYAISGFGTVQLVCAMGLEHITVPECVEYLGTSYTVTSIGRMENGFFEIGSIAFDYETENTTFVTLTVSVPKTVIFIWDGAFDIDSLVSINVAEDNESFTSDNGVLFTEDMSTLIKYPAGRTDTSYTVPDGVVKIAGGAFAKFYYNRTLSLRTITLGRDTEIIGIVNYGYGYTDLTHGNFIEGEIANILHYMQQGGKVLSYSGDELE